jgi:hypothetical protein
MCKEKLKEIGSVKVNMRRIGKIYKLYIEDCEEVDPYYGSTFGVMLKRMIGHESDYRRWKRGDIKSCISSYKLFKYAEEHRTEVKYKVLEEHEEISNEELLIKEGTYQMNNKCVNKQIAGGLNIKKRKKGKTNSEKGIVKENCPHCGNEMWKTHMKIHMRSRLCEVMRSREVTIFG